MEINARFQGWGKKIFATHTFSFKSFSYADNFDSLIARFFLIKRLQWFFSKAGRKVKYSASKEPAYPIKMIFFELSDFFIFSAFLLLSCTIYGPRVFPQELVRFFAHFFSKHRSSKSNSPFIVCCDSVQASLQQKCVGEAKLGVRGS